MRFAIGYIWLFHIHLDSSLRKVFILDYQTVNIVTVSPTDYWMQQQPQHLELPPAFGFATCPCCINCGGCRGQGPWTGKPAGIRRGGIPWRQFGQVWSVSPGLECTAVETVCCGAVHHAYVMWEMVHIVVGIYLTGRSKGFRTCLFVVNCRGRDLLNADGWVWLLFREIESWSVVSHPNDLCLWISVRWWRR